MLLSGYCSSLFFTHTRTVDQRSFEVGCPIIVPEYHLGGWVMFAHMVLNAGFASVVRSELSDDW